jgi:hypothetical protein
MAGLTGFTRHLHTRKMEAGPGGVVWFILAWLFSILFHPLLIPCYSTLVFFYFDSQFLPLSREAKSSIVLFIFGSTFLLPAAGIGLIRAAGFISSLSMEERKDRHLPHLIAFLSYLTTAFLLHFFLPGLVLPILLLLGAALSVGITGLITLYWKISSHLVGLGGFLGFQLALVRITQQQDLGMLIAISALLCGAVALSRFYLKAHDVWQLIAGFLLGMVISSFTVSFFAEFF